ncbi:MAG: PQQ-dependent sugar dehydrogenase [Planctomycetota bacterium]
MRCHLYLSVLFAAWCSAPPVAGAADCAGVPAVAGEEITLELIASGLDRPVDVQAPPGDRGRLFIVEQRGRIRIFDLTAGALRPEPFLDIGSKVSCCGELGLLGLAFHPDFASNGLFYVNTTRPAGAVCTASPPPGCPSNRAAETVVARFQASPPEAGAADPDSELVLLAFCQPFSNHNAGQLRFGPLDGYLYVATGDGGDAGDPCNSGQRGDSLLGKILRIDVDSDAFPDDPLRNYAIPADNPFASPSDGVRDEIWALGLRNPWRFAFDAGAPDGSGRGDIYIGDVGQGSWEEIDYRPAAEAGGENYEWRVREGAHPFSAGTPFGPGARTGPVYEYPHGSGVFRGCSVTGGVVYRGCRMPDLSGAYFFADFCNGWVATFRISAGEVSDLRDRTADLRAGIAPAALGSVSAFGTDGLGEVYILDLGGRLFRVVPKPPPNHPPRARIATEPDPPVLSIGGVPPQLTLDGSASDDGDGGTQGLSFLWEATSGPGGEEIFEPEAARTTVRISVPGVYVFRLTVSDGLASDAAEVTVTVLRVGGFRRADANGDGSLDISDGLFTLLALFAGTARIGCEDAADADDTGAIDISDAIFTFLYLFLGGPPPPAPGPFDCGDDPTEDALGCESQGACSPP